MRHAWLLLLVAPLLSSCAATYAVRFETRAFPTRPNQKVVLITQRGRTDVRGVAGSRDIVVGGTVRTFAGAPAAEIQTRAVAVRDTSVPSPRDPELRLEVTGIPASGTTLFDAEFLVPRDVRLEIYDGPEDLTVTSLGAGVSIVDGPGDILLEEIVGPVEIADLDGSIFYRDGRGPVFINDRRGQITIQEVTGNIDITDREDDTLIQSVTGNFTMRKNGAGYLRVSNLDGPFHIREWLNNSTKPIINTIWDASAPPATPAAQPVPASAGPGSRAPASRAPPAAAPPAAPPEKARKDGR